MKVRNRKIDKIFILESLPASETTGNELYNYICATNKFLSSNVRFLKINSKQEFFKELNQILEESEENQGIIIDIECHGNINGLILSNHDCIDWYELTDKLRCINKKTIMGLVVIFSCCYGAHFLLNGITIFDRIPFYMFFAPDREIYEHKLFQANIDLFNSFLDETSYSSVVENINSYLRINENVIFLVMEPGDLFEKSFKKYLSECCSPGGLVSRVKELYDDILDISKETGKSLKELEILFMRLVLDKNRLKKSFEQYQNYFLCLDLDSTLFEEYEVEFENVYKSSGIEEIYKKFKDC